MSPLEVLSAASNRLEAETTLSILAAAGYVVMPVEPTQAALTAWDKVDDWLKNDVRGVAYALEAAKHKARGEPYYRAMVATAEAGL